MHTQIPREPHEQRADSAVSEIYRSFRPPNMQVRSPAHAPADHRFLALILLAAYLGATACSEPGDPGVVFDFTEPGVPVEWQAETDRIRFGTEDAHPHLTSGFGLDESLPGGGHRVASRGETSSLSFFLSAPRPLQLEIDWAADSGAVPVEVSINGHPQPLQVARSTRARSQLTASAGDLTAGTNTLDFHYRSPSEARPARVYFYELRLGRNRMPSPLPPNASPTGDRLRIPTRTRAQFALLPPAGSVLEFAGASASPGADGHIEIEWEAADGVRGHLAAVEPGSAPVRIALPRVEVPIQISFTAVPAAPDRGAGFLELHEPVLRSPEGIRGGKRRRPNILLYVSDTLRPDHLGSYGYASPISTAIDELAADGIVFDRAFAQSSWTRPSMASLFTGLDPRRHGVTDTPWALPPEAITLAERLRAGGYRTAAFVANPYISPGFGMKQGFSVFKHVRNRRRPAAAIHGRHQERHPQHEKSDDLHEATLDWLSERDEDSPFFLYVHSMNPHAPYRPPDPFRTRFAGDVGPSDRAVYTDIEALARGPVSPELLAKLQALYDAEIATNDHALGILLDDLRERGLYDDTLIIFLSDHGEAFWERQQLGHGHNLYAETLDIPLIIKPPGNRAPTTDRVRRPVSHVDLLPTVLEFLELPSPDETDGHSFASLIDAGAPLPAGPSKPVFGHLDFGELLESESVIDGRWKMIRTRDPAGSWTRPALYDLRQDPRELENLSLQKPHVRARLEKLLEERDQISPAWPVRAAEVDAALLQQLEALGYKQ